ncbi:MAG TPA: hypoxanthine phosphoribosyltransferase [Candidatus Avidesulfovibrio excrementigallinarum]|nr:hypoxanthine phosphoribosyltransferase [Candidatus Avidesulfovibrio excrementigallinarum]
MRIAAMNKILDEAQIARRLDELAAELDELYRGRPLVVICVLKGGIMFFADLVRRLNCQPELDFVRLSSYGDGTSPQAKIVLTKDVELSLRGKHVLVVEDIMDTGHSMEFLLRHLASKGAESIRLAVLVDKQERREVAVRPDIVGFSVPSGFLIGYGLDYAEQYRELPAVYELIPTEE